MKDELEKEIQDALSNTGGDHILEVPISEAQSPLNKPVKTGDIADISEKGKTETASFRKTAEDAYAHEQTEKIIADAPEQHIGSHAEEISQGKETTTAVISDKQATQTAEALLGMADNFLAVGGGFFVKITKHEEFFEFEELVEVIDSQNEKNIRRIRLGADDKALLTPLLAQVIKNKTKQLTPEQQLLGAIISVIVKKAQTVMEVRAENKSLEGRILQIVREAKLPDTKQEEKQEQEEQPKEKAGQASTNKEAFKQEILEEEQEIQAPFRVVKDDEEPVFIPEENAHLTNEMSLVYEEVTPSDVSQKQARRSSASSNPKTTNMASSKKQDEGEHSKDSDDTS